ncbi:protein UNUSUAL FLORAL ORGANS [Tripterygium wilfordii]|uniref:Protein UNUSUAL FLORAL ORGANS n=1 Tax=Tripterygium wilfordii TaxID=458696 RepID=A0A7J7E1U0_TRIWF|nr:protein UNUSUAL FLORAL ORGANS [Tripterygium wilfordii]KAF5752501.1 protein UNUSUAL FLORAL ORGANS [Tripterygium wilfordii]
MEAFSTTSMPLPYSYTHIARSSTTSSDPTSPWMDSRIWSKLPQRLLERVIAFLPPPAFFRARAVCKRWYGLLFSNNFLELYIQVSPRRHWFLFFEHKTTRSYIYRNNNNYSTGGSTGQSRDNFEGYLFDPYEITWYRIPFALIPSGFSPAASSGGLVCWVSDEAGTKSLVLSNPLFGSLTPLPPTLRPRLFPSIGLNVGLTSIDVTLAGDDLISPYAVKNLSTESFHVDTSGFYSLWGTTSALPRLCSLESGQMVYTDRKFYSMNQNPYSILGYDISSNTWLKIQAPMRRFLRSPSLLDCRGKLVLIAAVEKSKLNVPKSLRLWGLQACGTTWVEIERMPQQLYLQFAEMESGCGFDCVGHGEFVVITIHGSDKALLFDMVRKRWQWIPPCPYVVQGGDGELHGFAYEPRLATPVTGLLDQLTLPFQPFNG